MSVLEANTIAAPRTQSIVAVFLYWHRGLVGTMPLNFGTSRAKVKGTYASTLAVCGNKQQSTQASLWRGSAFMKPGI